MSYGLVKRQSIVLASIVAVGFGAGCSGDSGTNSREEIEARTAEEFLERRAEIRAEVRCRAQNERCEGKPTRKGSGETVGACRSRLLEKWKEGTEGGEQLSTDPALSGAIERGAVEYDREAGEKCLRNLRSYVGSLSCIQTRRLGHLIAGDFLDPYLFSACEEAWDPQREEGAECATSASCESDLVCGEAAEDGDSGCGECQPPGARTRPDVRRFAFVEKGEACGGPNYDPICNPTEALVCSRESEDGDGWSCVDEGSRAEGEPCGEGACEDGLVCRDGTCQPFTIAEEGSSCTEEHLYCESGLVCGLDSENSGVCVSLGGAGDRCDSDDECERGLLCVRDSGSPDYAVGECREPGEVGEECNRDEECRDGLYCDVHDTGQCTERRGMGEPCEGAKCEAGLECSWEPSVREYQCSEVESTGEMESCEL